MKHTFPPVLVVIFILFSISLKSQSKNTCDTPNESLINDLNSISKCTIKKESDNKRKVTLNISSNKTRKRVIRKRDKVNSLGNATNKLKKEINNHNKIEVRNKLITKKVVTQEILFSIVDEVPLFPKCSNIDNKSDCFNEQFSKHFAKYFDPERASDEGINGRVFLQFTIDIKGNVNNLLIKSKKNNKQLELEIERVVSKLPKFSPGKHNGLPVNVKYSLPINFNN